MITIYDAKEKEFAGNGLIVLEPDECKVIHEINGDFSADLVHHHDAQGKWRYIQEQRILRIPTPEGKQLFRIYSVSHDGQTKQMIAKARHIFYDLSDNFLEDVRPTEINGAGAMERISSGTQYTHPFRFGSDVSNISTAYYIRTNPVAALMGAENAVINRWGGELERDNFDVMLRARVGADHGVQIRYGKNMTAINLQYDISKIATRIMPTGLAEDGQTVVALPEKYVDSKHIGIYPHPIVTHIHYSDIKVDTENGITINEVYNALRERANAEFDAGIDLPETYGTVSFVDLSTTEQYKNRSVLETVHLGDTVTVKNAEMGIDTKTRVLSYTYEATKGRYESIEFGQIKPGIGTVLERISSALQDEITIAKSDLQKAIDKATELLTSVLGGYVIKRRGEILIMDTEDPETAQKVWRWNLNGLGYSSAGINGPYSLAITMDGKIVADFITAGVLNGELLKAGSVKADKIDAKGLTVNNGVTDTLRVDENGDVSLNVKSLSITGNQVATQGDVANGINGLQIGGRNLLLNTGYGDNLVNLNYWVCSKQNGTGSISIVADGIHGKVLKFTRGSDSTGWFYFANTSLNSKGFKFTVGQKYTLSFWALRYTDNTVLHLSFKDGNSTNQSMYVADVTLKQGWNKYEITATATAAGNTNSLYIAQDIPGKEFCMAKIKLELGTKATDWTPAPEDRAYLVNTLSPTQADGMWLGSDGKLNITATQIKAGKLQSKDGSSYFDLENGKIVGKNAEITGSFQALSPNYTSSEGSSVTISGFTQSGSSFNCAGLQFRNAKNTLYGDVWGVDLGSNGVSIGMECDGAFIAVNKNSSGKYINMQGDYITLNVGNYLYHTGTIQCGDILVPNGTASGGVYTGETTIYFSPAFSKAPRVSITPRTGNPYNVTASLGGPPTANSVKIIVQRNTKTADGYTGVQWIAVEPR